MNQILSYPLEKIKTDGNIRSDLGPEEELIGLGMDMKANGQQMPCLLDPDDVLMDGYRRLAAARLVGLPALDCIKWHRKLEGWEIQQFQLASVLHRKDVSAWDKAVAARDIKAANPGMTNKQLAEEVLHNDPSAVTRLLSLFDCPAGVQDAAKAGKIGIADWYAISKSPDPLATLALKMGGASAAELNASTRPRPTPQPEDAEEAGKSDKPGTVKIALPGVIISIKGEDLTIARIVDLLATAYKESDRAKTQGLTARSFSNVMRDRAKKPPEAPKKAKPEAAAST